MAYNYEKLKEVGKVSAEALQHAKTLLRPGAKVRDVCESIEQFFASKGMLPAFPVNLSVNERAAHYTAAINDTAEFTAKDLIKVDLGARSGTVLGDCAITIDLSGEHAKLIEAAEEALEAALSVVRAGAPVNSIGKEVARVCKSKNLNPIKNLGGHAIEEEELHASLFVPNFDNGDTTPLKEGRVVAVETFVTDGQGFVIDSDMVQIFQKTGDASPRSEDARKITAAIDRDYQTYPFAVRWLAKEIDSEFKIRKALNELSTFGVIEPFPTLVEKSGGMVAQAEKEVIVERDSCAIVTK